MFKKRLTKLLSISLSVVICLALFSFPVYAVTPVSSKSQFKCQTEFDIIPDVNCPYPDGCFLEQYNIETGRCIVFNFMPTLYVSWSTVNPNGDVVSEFNPYQWGKGTIYSSMPIYRANASRTFSLASSWSEYGTVTPTPVENKCYQYVDGVLTEMSSSNTYSQKFYATFTFSPSTYRFTCNKPMCTIGYGNTNGYQYCSDYKLAPILDSEILQNESTSTVVNDLNNMYSRMGNMLNALTAIKDNTDQVEHYLDVFETELIGFRTEQWTLNYNISEYCMRNNVQLQLIKDWLETTYIFLQDEIYVCLNDIYDLMDYNFSYIEDQLQEIINGGEQFGQSDVWGTDESGLSDITSDFSFNGTGINSVVSNLGNSFNLLKINFESICNLFGLNEIIVLLLGFSTICFILGRVIKNKMRE